MTNSRCPTENKKEAELKERRRKSRIYTTLNIYSQFFPYWILGDPNSNSSNL
jgi:hypothetical protein